MTLPQFPTMIFDPRGNWEFILPAAVFPDGIVNITVSTNGIYVEAADGQYDLITFDDLRDIAIPGRVSAIPTNGHGPSAWIYAIEDNLGVIAMQ